MNKLELLAPAKDYDHGVVAINYGADAVYIGAPKFGARSAAGNSMDDIERLARYAHKYGAKVYMALNTLLYDDELEQAHEIAVQAWNSGVDALIIQDMALAQMDLPPIQLHASTQTFNASIEKAAFFEKAGFSRIVLERALNIKEIAAISAACPNTEIEAFVHGAICVCYSGQCYMSASISSQSGNRGNCLQPCRWDFNLVDENKRKLIEGKHLLSVGDLNLSNNLREMADAGVSSFKIEGRLKDMTYLKNSVALYRAKLDEIGERSSYGSTVFDFTPEPDKSFSRGFTTYYFEDKTNKVSSFNTPKSIGEYVGKVLRINGDGFIVDGKQLNNGDGICFMSDGVYMGTNINTASDIVVPNRMDGIKAGVEIYRNYDHSFVRALENSRTRRAIEIDMMFDGGTLTVTDCQGISVTRSLGGDQANNPDKMRETIASQLRKTGDTPFVVRNIEVKNVIFITTSALNALRREILESLESKRIELYDRGVRKAPQDAAYPEKTLGYLGNVTNSISKEFYRQHGVGEIAIQDDDYIGNEIMRTRYCIRREIGECLKESKYRGGLHIENNFNIFELKFDCARCEMSIIYKGKKE